MTMRTYFPAVISSNSRDARGIAHTVGFRPDCQDSAYHNNAGSVNADPDSLPDDHGDDQDLAYGRPADETVSTLRSDGKRPKSWGTLLFSTLKTLVVDAKGAASEQVLEFIET